MKELCPVCNTEYSQNVTKCKVCGFADELGINRTWPIVEDAENWLNTVVKPYRIKWQKKQRKKENSTPQLIANDYYVIGRVHYRNGDYDKAIKNFNEAIRLDPNHAVSYSYRGLAYEQKGDCDNAISDYISAIQAGMIDEILYKNRGNLYFAKKEYDLAIADFTKAIEINPNYADAYVLRGAVYRSKKNYEQAISDYTKAIAIDPNDALKFKFRGVAYKGKGITLVEPGDISKAIKSLEQAITDFSKAIEMEPKDAQTYVHRGYAYGLIKRGDLAMVDFAKAIEIDVNCADAYLWRGNQYYIEKKHDLALLDFARAVEITSLLPDAFKYAVRNILIDRYNLGMIAYNAAYKKSFGKQKLFLEAIDHFNQGIKSAESFPGVLPPEELAMFYQRRAESFTAASVSPFNSDYIKDYYEETRQLDPLSIKEAKMCNGYEMVFVASDSFQMGDKKSVHKVMPSAFYIGKTAVTQELYELVMKNNPSHFRGGNLPVENVTWYDAVEFCNKLSEREGLQPVYTISGRNPATGYPITPAAVTTHWNRNGYRLPIQVEWEYAAKGGNGSPENYTYAGSNNVDSVAWYRDNSGKHPHAVGTKAPNGLGIYDMSGNVWEWCCDWYMFYGFGGIFTACPMVRGGGWRDSAGHVRSVSSNYHYPLYKSNSLGFRLVRH